MGLPIFNTQAVRNKGKSILGKQHTRVTAIQYNKYLALLNVLPADDAGVGGSKAEHCDLSTLIRAPF